MLLRLLALLFASLGLLIGLGGGWSMTFGALLGHINPRGMATLEDTIRSNWSGIWDSLALPLFSIPAWTAPLIVALALFLAAALRPGRG